MSGENEKTGKGEGEKGSVIQLSLGVAPEPAETITAISLWEPWATAMAMGLKKNETRSWSTNHRGPLVICAALRPLDALAREVCRYMGVEESQLGFGKALCVVDLVDCVDTIDITHPGSTFQISAIEASLGNYDDGRVAWLTRDLQKFARPFPVKGRQGLFHILNAQVLEALRHS